MSLNNLHSLNNRKRPGKETGILAMDTEGHTVSREQLLPSTEIFQPSLPIINSSFSAF